ncbi:MAG: outer membrane beta-barrel protein [Gemmataceae bacterium]
MKEYPLTVEWFPKWLGQDEKKNDNGDETPPFRRALPSPWDSPPFPSSEYQGPTIGLPPSSDVYPLMKAIYGGGWGDEIKESRVKAYGWFTTSGNWSTSRKSNTPDSYWIVPNRYELDQTVLVLEREVNTAQADHIDWGFNFTQIYGIDYRYTTGAGYFSDQLLKHNRLYGYDPLEIYLDLYVPGIADGLTLRVGRYISPPDIEAQLAPGNYLASHSILFTYDDYTHTGVMATVKLNDYWTVQAAIYAGGDMAPWYPGAIPTGFFGVKWISHDNQDSVYTCLNAINGAQFRLFPDGTGHDNFNYVVSTWTHAFSKRFHTSTEAYYLWQYNALQGGTVSTGPPQSFGGGGGPGPLLPGNSPAYGVLNYSMLQMSKKDYITLRNEWWRDERGQRTGFATNYSSHTVGLSHQFSSNFLIRPEIGYFHSYDVPAFDLGTKKNQVQYGFDMTVRF